MKLKSSSNVACDCSQITRNICDIAEYPIIQEGGDLWRKKSRQKLTVVIHERGILSSLVVRPRQLEESTKRVYFVLPVDFDCQIYLSR